MGNCSGLGTRRLGFPPGVFQPKPEGPGPKIPIKVQSFVGTLIAHGQKRYRYRNIVADSRENRKQ